MPTVRAALPPLSFVTLQGNSVTSAPGGGQAKTAAPSEQQGQTQAPPKGQERQPACYDGLIMFVPFIALLYFLVLRPQQKQEKQRRAMLTELKKGDDVVTTGGVHGQVVALGETTVTIKFGSDAGQRFKIDRAAVQRVIPKDQPKNGESA